MADIEPVPNFSVGFEFDDPLAGLEEDRPVTPETLAALSFLSCLTSDFDTVLTNPRNGVTHKTTYFPLIDGVIMTTEFLTKVDGMQLVDERVIAFGINNPSDNKQQRKFDVILGQSPQESMVEDFGVVDQDAVSPAEQLIGDAIELNMAAQLDEVPDKLPSQRNDGTMRSDMAFEEAFGAGNRAIEEVIGDIVSSDESSISEIEPVRTLQLGDKFARKIIGILEPIIFTRLDVDTAVSEE